MFMEWDVICIAKLLGSSSKSMFDMVNTIAGIDRELCNPDP